MKKKICLVASIILCCGTMFGQPKSAGEPKMFIKSDHGLMAPVWSPDGSKIAVTGDNYTGIWVVNSDGSSFSKVTDDDGAGYKMAWSQDGKTILGRTNQMVNKKKFHEIKTYDISSGKATLLVPSTRGIKGTPTWESAGNISYSDSKGAYSLKTVGKAVKTKKLTAYEEMVNDPVNATASIAGLQQYAGKIVINPALSPDKSKIAFQIPGAGAFICDADGSNMKSIGKGSYPCWLPDNKTVVVARIKDNGVTFTSSDLFAINTATGKEVLLTGNTNLIPVTHAVSPKGDKIAFENSSNGCIYIMDLKY